LPVQGLFLVALAIVTAAEGSPVKILDLIADGLEGMLGGLVEGAAGAQRQGEADEIVQDDAVAHARNAAIER
jgi:hypothetical protein